MTKLVLEFDVPNGVNPEWIRTTALDHISKLIKSTSEKEKEEHYRRCALESDNGLQAWLSRYGYEGNPPMTRANRYKEIWFEQELEGWSGDPRRPVFMKGAFWVLVSRHAKSSSYQCSNGWIESVLGRYLRFCGYTCFDRNHHHDNMKRLLQRLKGRRWTKGRYTARLSLPGMWKDCEPNDCAAWINGKHQCGLTIQQKSYLRKLDQIRHKFSKADDRAAKLRQMREERMAA